MRGHEPTSLELRFWAHVDRRNDDECWQWLGARSSTGYGNVTERIAPRRFRTVKAHRAAWELTNGPVPDGLRVLHRCDVPLCVNPAHLFLGTPADNSADMVAKGRSVAWPGELNPSARLTESDVREIRRQAGKATLRELATTYGVSHRQIGNILHRRAWSAVS